MSHVPAFDILDRLIAFPSVSRDGNIDLIRYVSALLADAGIESRLFPSDSGDRASLFATVGPEGPGGIVLSGHTDVVPVDGQDWTHDPFRLTDLDGRLHGRGTTDMKGFVACAIEALLAAKSRPLIRPLHLALSYDEEIGCVGVRPMLAELSKAGLCPDWVLIGEPTSMQVASGHKGKLAARASCCGAAAHSALAPTGLNAIHLAADFLAELRLLQSDLADHGPRDDDYDIPYTTIHAGVIRGGTALNIVPEHCLLDFEIRNIAADNPKRLLDRLFEKAETLSRGARQRFPSTGIAIEVINDYPGLAISSNEAALAQALALAGSNRSIKVAFGTEGGLFSSALDVPAVVCGPGSMDQGHKADEYVERAQIDACRVMLARLTEGLAA
ncbi:MULTISPECIES: acetylornithine deacetylase [Alphaproteobacteria]|uniref:Acetylornithine deacetylase n=2 Tax=Alphaproteobacteria TaxID=28211 RepID=A0A512HNI0_9HYPH|nr:MULTISPECIES: acetylornithine deacetylase [Alphaproteobacteria]GEO87001.1 acetylornithine deacetylase [Ciceribacter naphthalenivorans]GLR21623.1 acetylornithine deacetylase [Ciceribacter naphthalenivorans]GLT04479.1 acetylornithine deacetylase [Sphingomonas psychrolutea]